MVWVSNRAFPSHLTRSEGCARWSPESCADLGVLQQLAPVHHSL